MWLLLLRKLFCDSCIDVVMLQDCEQFRLNMKLFEVVFLMLQMMLIWLLLLLMVGVFIFIDLKQLRCCRWILEWLIVVCEYQLFLNWCILWCIILLEVWVLLWNRMWCIDMCGLGMICMLMVMVCLVWLVVGIGFILVNVQLILDSELVMVFELNFSRVCENVLLDFWIIMCLMFFCGRMVLLLILILEILYCVFLVMFVVRNMLCLLGLIEIWVELMLKLMQL